MIISNLKIFLLCFLWMVFGFIFSKKYYYDPIIPNLNIRLVQEYPANGKGLQRAIDESSCNGKIRLPNGGIGITGTVLINRAGLIQGE